MILWVKILTVTLAQVSPGSAAVVPASGGYSGGSPAFLPESCHRY